MSLSLSQWWGGSSVFAFGGLGLVFSGLVLSFGSWVLVAGMTVVVVVHVF